MTRICVNAMNAGICVILAVIITQNAVSVKDGTSSSPITFRIRIGSRATCARPGQGGNDDSPEGRNDRAAEAFPDNYRGPAHWGDRHLAREPELPVPRNRRPPRKWP
jgi:hypothetical protein